MSLRLLPILFALSACGSIEGMTVIPIRYAPVKIISGSIARPAQMERDFELAGCWEHVPGGTLPTARRWYAPIACALFNFFYGEVQTPGSLRTTVKEKTRAEWGPDYLLISESSLTPGTRREAFSWSGETLTIDGKAYRKLADADSEARCLPTD